MRIVQVLVVCLMLLPVPARAQVLVELFTSQGCSSCPPADTLLGELAKRDDVIALSYHVDYWDYLGWKDTFAQAAFSDRQRAYSGTVDRQYIGRRLRGSFTPEVVVGGRDSLIGSSRQGVVSRIIAQNDQEPRARIALSREGDALTIELTPLWTGIGEVRVMLAQVDNEATVDIRRGENRGRTLTYHRVVRDLSSVGNWDGKAAGRLTLPDVPGHAVVFLQQGHAGPVLAVAEIR